MTLVILVFQKRLKILLFEFFKITSFYKCPNVNLLPLKLVAISILPSVSHEFYIQFVLFLAAMAITVLSQPNPTSTTTPTQTQQKSWVNRGITKNQPPYHPLPHHKLKLHERIRMERYLENKSCSSIYIKPKKIRTQPPPQK